MTPIMPHRVGAMLPAPVAHRGVAAPHPNIVAGPYWYNATIALNIINTTAHLGSNPPAIYGESMTTVNLPGTYSYNLVYGGFLKSGGLSNQTWLLTPPVFGPSYWVNITNNSNHPPALAFASMTYDPRIPAVVLFGGYAGGFAISNETWLWNLTSGAWTNDTTLSCAVFCPGARLHADMVFAGDAADNHTVLFGGCSNVFCTSEFNDTWNLTYFLGTYLWAPDQYPIAPSPRLSAMMVYGGVGAGNSTWLFGGCEEGTLTGTCSLNDTWEFSGGAWINWSSAFIFLGQPSPPGRAAALMTFDAGHQDILLAGGLNDSVAGFSDTWVLSCPFFCGWTNTTLSSPGLPVVYGAISSNSTLSEPTALGGWYNGVSVPTNTTWVFQNDTSWFAAASNLSPEVNQSVQFNTTVVIGPSFDAFGYAVWQFYAPSGTVNTTFDNTTTSFRENGTYAVNVLAFDAFDVSEHFFGAISVGIPTVAALASHVATDVGRPVTFSETVGGVHQGSLTYSWAFGDGGTASSATAVHTYSSHGTYNARVLVTDQYANASSTVQVTVHPVPSVTVTGSPPLSGTVSVGQNVTFTPHVANGTPGYTYSWSFGDGSAASASATPTHAYAVKGNYTVNLTTTDSVGGSNLTHVVVHVAASAVPLSATASSNVSGARTGVPIQFTASASGGSGSYNYAWHFGDGATGTGATASHAYSAAGAFTATVWVNDTAGHSVTQTVGVTITSGNGNNNPNGNGNSGSAAIPSWEWALIAVIVLAAILGIILVLRRRGGGSKPTGPPTPLGSAAGTPPGGALRAPPSGGSGGGAGGGPPAG